MSGFTPTALEPPVDTEGSEIEGQIVLILCGLIASGKSTFAEALQQHFPQFRRCNQDDLGDRRRVERLARQTLNQGFSVCVDRTNFNAPQRSYWIEIAREVPGTTIWVIVFDTPYETCAARLQTRTGHPTITNPEQGLSVLSRFAADFEAPSPHEGFDRILYVKPEDHPSPVYARSDIAAILRRVRDSTSVMSDAGPSPLGSGPEFGNPYRGGGRGYHSQQGYNRSNYGIPANGAWGLGGNCASRSSPGPFYGFRGWQRTPHRGSNTSVSTRVAGRGQSQYAILQSENNSSEIRGEGSSQDPFVID